MEHVGPLAISLQKALGVNHMDSEVSFVSEILNTLIKVLNDKYNENKYVDSEIQQYQAILDNKVFESKPTNTEEVGETMFDDKTDKTPTIIEHGKFFERIELDEIKQSECEGGQEYVNSCNERTLNDAEKKYILESVQRLTKPNSPM